MLQGFCRHKGCLDSSWSLSRILDYVMFGTVSQEITTYFHGKENSSIACTWFLATLPPSFLADRLFFFFFFPPFLSWDIQVNFYVKAALCWCEDGCSVACKSFVPAAYTRPGCRHLLQMCVPLGRIWNASASWRFRIISGIGTPVTYALAQNGLASRHGTQPLQIMRNQQLDHLGKVIILNV